MLKTSPERTRKCVFMELQTIFEEFEVLTDEELLEVSGGGVTGNHFRNQEESTDCIVMHRRQRYERGKKRFSLVFHYRV